MYVYIICTKKEQSFPRLASHSQTLSQHAVLHKAAQNIHTLHMGEIRIREREREKEKEREREEVPSL